MVGIINKSKSNKKTHNKTIKRNMSPRATPFPIDVVYTWKGENASNDRRLGYNHELQYSLRSVHFFAPWVNKIFILMNNAKQPSWIKDNSKIIIVEHSETFPSEKYLPNTNSNAIETTIANIKGLSNHYIYFNDDIFLGRKVKYTDFFTSDGKALIDDYTLQTRNIVKEDGEQKLKFELPESADKLYKHIPISLIKNLVLDFNKTYSDYVDWIRMTKKRKDKGYDICEKNNLLSPCQQIHYPIAEFMYLHKKAKIFDNENTSSVYVSSAIDDFSEKLDDIASRRPKFFCINDVEPDPGKRKVIASQMLRFFKKYFPNKADFEK